MPLLGAISGASSRLVPDEKLSEKDRILQEKEAELRRMQEMLKKMQEQMQQGNNTTTTNGTEHQTKVWTMTPSNLQTHIACQDLFLAPGQVILGTILPIFFLFRALVCYVLLFSRCVLRCAKVKVEHFLPPVFMSLFCELLLFVLSDNNCAILAQGAAPQRLLIYKSALFLHICQPGKANIHRLFCTVFAF